MLNGDIGESNLLGKLTGQWEGQLLGCLLLSLRWLSARLAFYYDDQIRSKRNHFNGISKKGRLLLGLTVLICRWPRTETKLRVETCREDEEVGELRRTS